MTFRTLSVRHFQPRRTHAIDADFALRHRANSPVLDMTNTPPKHFGAGGKL
jgi:hypothetical protein